MSARPARPYVEQIQHHSLCCLGVVVSDSRGLEAAVSSITPLLEILHAASTPGVLLSLRQPEQSGVLGVAFLIDEWPESAASLLSASVPHEGGAVWEVATRRGGLLDLVPRVPGRDLGWPDSERDASAEEQEMLLTPIRLAGAGGELTWGIEMTAGATTLVSSVVETRRLPDRISAVIAAGASLEAPPIPDSLAVELAL